MQQLQLQNNYRQILLVALPMCASFLIPQLNILFNTIFQSHLGLEVLGNAGIVGIFYLIFAVLGYGLSTGLQVFLSYGAGANDIPFINRYFFNATLLHIVFAILIVLCTFILLPQFIYSSLGVNASSEIIIAYCKIRIIGLPFLYGFQTLNALLTSVNKTKWLPVGAIVETVVNIVLDYALIFGNWGLPNMGFLGAAYASVIAEITACCTMIIIICCTAKSYISPFQYKHIKLSILKKLAKKSSPLILQHGISVSSFWIFFLLLKRNTDEISIALAQPVRIIFGIFGVSLFALSSATNVFVSNFIGQNRIAEIKTIIHKILLVSLSIALLGVGLLHLFSLQIFSLFNEGLLLHEHANNVLIIISLVLIILSVSIIYFNAIIGLGLTKKAFFIEVWSAGLYFLYVLFVVEIYKLGLNIGWLGEFVYWLNIGLLAYILFHNKLKKMEVEVK